MNSTDKFFLLMQLGDSAFPVGGYAYSYGLESAYHLGFISNSSELFQYSQTYVRNIAFGEMPFLNSAFVGKEGGVDFLSTMLFYYEATLLSESMCHASLSQGGNLLRTVTKIFPEAHFDDLKFQLHQKVVPMHYVPLFGWGLMRVGLTRIEAQQLFLFQSIRDQISAAIRLGMVGPMEGAVLQKDLYSYANSLEDVKDLEYSQAFREAPLLEFSQSYHEHLYSKLFQC